MSRKKSPTPPDVAPAPPAAALEDQLDALLDAALTGGWDDDTRPAFYAPVPATAPEYPPLPTREFPVPDARSTAGKRPATAQANEARAQISELLGLPANLTADQDATIDEGELPANKRMLNIGMLTDIATGRQSAEQAAATAGVSLDELQAGLAVELGQMDPADIAKAMGIQAAQEQLKAGALFGAVINDLVSDMVNGRLTPQLKLQLADMLAVIGRVKPKEDKSVGAGGGFVLNISMGAPASPQVTIEAQD